MEHPGIDDSVIWTEVIDDIEAVNPDVEDEPDELQDEDSSAGENLLPYVKGGQFLSQEMII